MIRINQIKIENNGKLDFYDEHGFPNEEKLSEILLKAVCKMLKVNRSDVTKISIAKHSIDARKKPLIYDIYSVNISLLEKLKEEETIRRSHCKNAQVISGEMKYHMPKAGNKELKDRPIVIGAGPAGLFCAYMLAKSGYRPILLERGADVDERQRIVESFWSGEALNIGANVQFGEGGAGTFSDGKLNTAVKDKYGRGELVLSLFVKNGAPSDIIYESKPHIGTDILTKVVKNIRNEIINFGGEVHFNTKVTELCLSGALGDLTKMRVEGVKTDNDKCPIINSGVVVLAIGHSARDTFEMLLAKKVSMEPKAFAVGLRVEHSQKMIDEIQYGMTDAISFPPSPYKLAMTSKSGRGVYSFCMCPGGFVVDASSEEGRLAINGMSYHDRGSTNANSAIVVSVTPKDYGEGDALCGMRFQRRLEEKAFYVGNGKIPVEYYDDFKVKRDANDKDDRIKPQIKGQYTFANVHEILPGDLYDAFVEGMDYFDKVIKGYSSNEDVLVDGIESRTSSPVRINRGELLESENVEGLFPCGEGAGYAGGIMSAAMDGIKVFEQIASVYKDN